MTKTSRMWQQPTGGTGFTYPFDGDGNGDCNGINNEHDSSGDL